jgi:hypothetical protein
MDVRTATNQAVISGLNQSQNTPASKGKSSTTQLSVQIDMQVDVYEHVEPGKKATYTKPGAVPEQKTLEQLMEESNKSLAHLKQIVTEMLKRQGLKFQNLYDITPDELKEVKVDEATQKEAQAMIAEGGEYSAASVSDRIVEFAKAISGGDKSKLDLLKTAIEKGFDAAGEAFNKKLPDICMETHELIMSKLDAWANEDEAAASQPDDDNNDKSVE